MTCPACGGEEIQDRKTVLDWRRRGDPITLHPECPNGHASHMSLVIKPNTVGAGLQDGSPASGGYTASLLSP